MICTDAARACVMQAEQINQTGKCGDECTDDAAAQGEVGGDRPSGVSGGDEYESQTNEKIHNPMGTVTSIG